MSPRAFLSAPRPGRSVQRLDLAAGKRVSFAAENNPDHGEHDRDHPNNAMVLDQTTDTLAGACAQSSQCIVAYAATSGVHTFAARSSHGWRSGMRRRISPPARSA